MADSAGNVDTHAHGSSATAAYREGVSDADILAQSDQIRREVEESQALVGPVEPLASLLDAYADNPVFIPKLHHLSTLVTSIRKTRGDGNCFYRSFLVSLGEQFVSAHVGPKGSGASSPLQAKYESTLAYVESSFPRLLALGYPEITLCDFFDTLVEYLTSLSAPGASVDTILTQFSDKMTGMYIITYMRCLCSLEILENEDGYLPYILGLAPHCATAKQFCDYEVEAVSTDADQLQIIACSRAWKVGVRIAYLDASPGDTGYVLTFPEEATPEEFPQLVSLLYRPGHYDVAYFAF
jgi:ubiquitin thioesterase protein OTUB1